MSVVVDGDLLRAIFEASQTRERPDFRSSRPISIVITISILLRAPGARKTAATPRKARTRVLQLRSGDEFQP